MSPIDCINTASDHSVCSAIGDEIAALYEHMDHCRGANCLYAKDFYDEFHSSYVTSSGNSHRTQQQHEPSAGGRVTILLHVPNLRKGVVRPDKVIVGGFAIRQVLDPPGSTSITEGCKYEDFYGRGAMNIPWDGADRKCFLTFSPKKPSDCFSSNWPAFGKWPDDGVVIVRSAVREWQGVNRRQEFVGRVSVKFFKTWPPSSPSEYDDREDLFGRIVVTTHLDGADPKCFLTIQSESSKADRDRNLCTPSSSARRRTAKSTMPESTRQRTSKNRKPYLPEEDELLLELKEKKGLSWKEICKQFPRRKYGSLQAHYAHRLKGR